MRVLFENRYGERREIGNVKTVDDAYRVINKFLNDHHFKSHYMRHWDEEGFTKVDVGSHSEFFLIDKEN